jgi:hypothetical protein
MLRRSSPQPDSLRDGSSNGRLNEDAIEQRLLGQVAAAHRVSREVRIGINLFFTNQMIEVLASRGIKFSGVCSSGARNNLTPDFEHERAYLFLFQ